MKKIILSFLMTTLFLSNAIAQSDTIYTSKKKIVATVKSIKPEVIKYTYPGENLSYSIYKNRVRKIVFHNGRVQKFKSYNLANIESVEDYKKVKITHIESNIKGLRKVAHIMAAAQGQSIFSSSKKMRNRAYRNIKLQAAMLGANVVLLLNSNSDRAKMGTYFSSAQTAKTTLSGVAYSTNYLDINEFKQKLGSKKTFSVVYRYKLKSTKSNIHKRESNRYFVISDIKVNNFNIYVYGKIDGRGDLLKYELARFNDTYFGLFHKKRKKEYYYKIKF